MKRALLVEDSKTSLVVAMRVLMAEGFSIVAQRGAAGARGLLDGKAFDVAIIDANIPEAEGVPTRGTIGIELARDIRIKWPKCRVIVWSADPSVESFALKIGATFVLKGDKSALVAAIGGSPFADPDELWNTIPAREYPEPRLFDPNPDSERGS